MNFKICAIFLAMTFGVDLAWSQKSTPFSGVWADSAGVQFKNQTAVFSVTSDQVMMTHYLEFNGQPFIEQGLGDRRGDTLDYVVQVTQTIPGWATEGKHKLVLDRDGKTLRGIYEDNKGNKGSLIFKKVK